MGTRQEWTYQDYSFPTIGTLTVDLTTLGESAEELTPPAFTVIPEIEIVSVNAKNFVSILSKSLTQVVFEHGSVGDLPPFTFTWRIVSNEASLDPASFYGSVAQAASLAGVSAGALTSAMQTQIMAWIDNQTFNGESFSSKTVTDESYDIGAPLIGSGLVKSIMLKHRPIISITSITDDARSSSPLVVNSGAYVLDEGGETGIVKLESKNVSGSDVITGFTRGTQALKVSYVWGFASVPAKVGNLATIMLAKWGEVNDQQSASDGLKSIQAGDYEEVYDLSFLNVRTKYDAQIKLLISELKKKYYNFV